VYTYAALPPDDSLHMPPKGKPQLESEEVKLIGWWINNGAPEHGQYAALSKPDSIQPLMQARFQPGTGVDLLDIPFADKEQIAALNTPYRTVQQLSATRPWIHVFMGSRTNFTGKDLKELDPVREQIVSVDLSYCNVKDEDLKALKNFPHLRKLHLQHTAVTDGGIRPLSTLAHLESLNLSGTGITAGLLSDLLRWPALKTIFLFNTAITQTQSAALQKASPKLEIHSTRFNVSDSLYYAQLVTPEVKVDSTFFHGAATVSVKPGRGKITYYYTLDGTEPDRSSTRYSGPFPVQKSGYVRLIATMDGWKDSKPVTLPLLRLGTKPERVTLETTPDEKFRDRLDTTLVDGLAGTTAHDEGKYLGFRAKDLRALFAFRQPTVFSKVSVSYLEAVNQGVMPPVSVEVWGGEKENQLRRLGTVQTDYPAKDRKAARYVVTAYLPGQPLRYLRVIARNRGILPPWHPSAKKAKGLILIDEVSFE
jgi:hypothetical protein